MKQARQELVQLLEQMSEAIGPHIYSMRKKPILGGVFGSSGFYLTSFTFVDNQLNEVRYFVFHETGLFLGYGETRADALRTARAILTTLDKIVVDTLFAKYRVKLAALAAEERKRLEESEAEMVAMRKATRQKVDSIPRRRKRIFDEAEGKCHYCATTLTLDGKWHVEHKMPKALGGGNEPGNLVASCVACNMKKRDTTDVEFRARLAKEQSA
jgi:hypothetical protein